MEPSEPALKVSVVLFVKISEALAGLLLLLAAPVCVSLDLETLTAEMVTVLLVVPRWMLLMAPGGG
jgi:hypothetical protein